jgi:hypothetical protein
VLRPDAIPPAAPFVVRRLAVLPRFAAIRLAPFFSLPFVGYLAIGAWMAFGRHAILMDAWSRLGNAYYVLFSGDPHLAAMGFVWNPLPSLLILPLLPATAVWPALVREGFAANIVSAAFMAGCVWQIHGSFRDWGLQRWLALALTVPFAIHPLILFFGANGMTEAMFVFFVLVTVRYLARWLREASTGSLAICGVALAFAYLTRIEGGVAAAGTTLVVMGMARWRYPPGERALTALADGLVVATPVVAAVVAWALASWVITGSPFEQLTSGYGIAAQRELIAMETEYVAGSGMIPVLQHVLSQIVGLAPLAGLVAVGAAVRAVIVRDPRVLAPLGVLGAVLLFSVYAFVAGQTFGWLRYYIAVVPLGVLLAGLLLAPRPGQGGQFAPPPKRGFFRAFAYGFLASAGLATVLASVAAGATTMLNPRLNRGDEGEQFFAMLGVPAPEAGHAYRLGAYESGRSVAAYLDSLGLPDHSVLIDVASGFPVVLSSQHPRQFIITPDRDFPAVNADPIAFQVQYIVAPFGRGQFDAIEKLHPGIYATGAGLGPVVGSFDDAGGDYRYRIIAVDGG